MAFIDARALRGRPSLRRALASLDTEQEQAFSASVADVDPTRFRSLYRDRAQQFLRDEGERTALRDQDMLQAREEELRQLRRQRDFPITGTSGPQRSMTMSRGLSRGGFDGY